MLKSIGSPHILKNAISQIQWLFKYLKDIALKTYSIKNVPISTIMQCNIQGKSN